MVELKGDGALGREAVSFKSMLKLDKVELTVVVGEAGSCWSATMESEIAGRENGLLKKTLEGYIDIFGDPDGLPPRWAAHYRINLHKGIDSISVRPYKYSQAQKDEIERLVNDMSKAGIIRPSSSPFSSPVLLVKKKDGSWHFCMDYRELNKVTMPNKYLITIIQEMLDELAGASIFSKKDLRLGFHWIRVHKDDIHETAFRNHSGHYEFVVMPFGLTNATVTFQSIMNYLFRPWLRKFVLVFFDDILVYSKTWREHKQDLEAVLKV